LKIFVSYCHKQGEWVWDRLVPVLKAGGGDVLIDRESFEAGKAIEGQMDATQDQGERPFELISPGQRLAGRRQGVSCPDAPRWRLDR
jgi:hypothetical protein